MVSPPGVQTGHISHPAVLVVPGDCFQGVHTASEDHLVIQGNAAGPPVMKIVCGPISCFKEYLKLLFAEDVLAH